MRNLDGVEVLGIEGTSFDICPRKCLVVGTDDPLGELDLFGEKKIFAQRHLISTLLSETASGDEVRGTSRKRKHPCEGIWVISLNDAEVLRQSGSDRSSLVRNLLVQEGRTALTLARKNRKERRIAGELF